MYAIDLLRQLNPLDIINELVKIPYFFDDIDMDNRIDDNTKNYYKEIIKQKYLDELDKIIKKDNKEIVFNDNEILLISNRIGSLEDGCLDCFTINIVEDKQNLLDNLKLSEFENVFNFKNPTKSICFTNRNIILGFRISNINKNKYSDSVLAAHILYELTTFAIDEIERENKTKEIIDSLIEQSTNIKEEKTYSLKELREILDIKDGRTNIQKYRERYTSMCDTYKSIINLIFDIQEVLIEENIIDDSFNGIDVD